MTATKKDNYGIVCPHADKINNYTENGLSVEFDDGIGVVCSECFCKDERFSNKNSKYKFNGTVADYYSTKEMTVCQLIAKLQTFDPNKIVMIMRDANTVGKFIGIEKYNKDAIEIMAV